MSNDHFETRLRELIGKDDDSVFEAIRRSRIRESLEISRRPGPLDKEGNTDAFLPFAWAEATICDCRKRARNKGLDFALTVGWVIRQLEQQHFCCAMSGIAFSKRRPRESHKRPWMPSLDRIDCTKGYTADNVRIVCVAVNTLLQDWGDSVFHELMATGKK